MPNKYQNLAKKLVMLEVRLAVLVEAIKSHSDFSDIETDAEEDFATFVDEVQSVVASRQNMSSDTPDPMMSFILDIEPIYNPATMAAASDNDADVEWKK